MPVRRIASSVLTSALDMAAPDEAATASVTRAPGDAAKTHVTRGGVDGLRVTGGRAVATAVIRRAKMRATLQHLARNADLRHAGVVAALLGRPARVLRRTAGTS